LLSSRVRASTGNEVMVPRTVRPAALLEQEIAVPADLLVQQNQLTFAHAGQPLTPCQSPAGRQGSHAASSDLQRPIVLRNRHPLHDLGSERSMHSCYGLCQREFQIWPVAISHLACPSA
jgi:hypothetical protein